VLVPCEKGGEEQRRDDGNIGLDKKLGRLHSQFLPGDRLV
jgi:hypothetical protein